MGQLVIWQNIIFTLADYYWLLSEVQYDGICGLRWMTCVSTLDVGLRIFLKRFLGFQKVTAVASSSEHLPLMPEFLSADKMPFAFPDALNLASNHVT